VTESEQLVKLKTWAKTLYPDDTPSIYTLRRWVREAKIVPAPQRHGRHYFVRKDARYINYNDPNFSRMSLV
jgi:predicted site-specific integrase-resolvase